MSLIVIIPARAGSRRIPGKNIKPFAGRPMIQYAVDLADFADRIIVTTDDEKIFEAANYKPGLPIEWVKRPPGLSTDEVGTQEVASHALRVKGMKMKDLVCVIYPTVPLLSPVDVDRGYVAMEERGVRYAFGVCEEPFGSAGAFYWGWAHAFTDGDHLVNEYSRMIPIPAERCQDINTPEDWVAAEYKYRALHPEAA